MRRRLFASALLALALLPASCKDKRPAAERLAEREQQIVEKMETLRQRQQQITVKLGELENRLAAVRKRRQALADRWAEPTPTSRATPAPS